MAVFIRTSDGAYINGDDIAQLRASQLEPVAGRRVSSAPMTDIVMRDGSQHLTHGYVGYIANALTDVTPAENGLEVIGFYPGYTEVTHRSPVIGWRWGGPNLGMMPVAPGIEFETGCHFALRLVDGRVAGLYEPEAGKIFESETAWIQQSLERDAERMKKKPKAV